MAKNARLQNIGSFKKSLHLADQGKDKLALEAIQTHLRKLPHDRGALNLAGTLAARIENWAQAEKYFLGSLALNASDTYALYNLSKVFKLSNRGGAAIEALTRLLKIEPGNVKALNEIGVLLADQGHLDPALKAFETAIELDPTFEKAYRNLYTTLYTGARYEEASYIAKRGIEHISSDYRWRYRADLILFLCRSRVFDEARQVAEELINELEQTNSAQSREFLCNALTNYGVVLLELDASDAAEVQFRKAIAAAPNLLDPYINIAKINAYRENYQESITWFDQALLIDPEDANLHNHLAVFLRDAGRPELALPHHLAAITRSPGDVEMRYYLAVTQFVLGQLESAYQNWDLRWTCREGGEKSQLPVPEWSGIPATGRALLVYREQGIGDEIIFASCLPDILSRFERIVCVCHSKLKPLFARSFPQIEFRSGGEALTQADIEELDWQIAIGSLPAIVRPTLAAFPHNPQFLLPCPKKVALFRERLAPVRKALTIGIGWRSGNLAVQRKMQYPYLEFWQPLFEIPGVTWVNLQYGDVVEELRVAETQFAINISNFDDVDLFNDLDSSAALMKACDLVIGTGTSTTMISAAVGVPTLRLSAGGDMFQLGTDYYPWLPSLTPIPRRFGESWTRSIQQTAAIVQALVAERSIQ
jgi:tetratricopeptide (TPR) repeat protein